MTWYSTGTVSINQGGSAVTGVGTNFLIGAQVGDGYRSESGILYQITAIESATQLTIAPVYAGATVAAGSYHIVPTQGLAKRLAIDVETLIALFGGFGGFYMGSSATDPTERKNGDPLEEGDMYANTVTGELMLYRGGAWQTGIAAMIASEIAAGVSATTATQQAGIATSAAQAAALSETNIGDAYNLALGSIQTQVTQTAALASVRNLILTHHGE